ncbi:hypothetical protein HPB48_018723 [Haemaphysalis longicornis]|uniref:PDZ domain-containing protein n=1 Tax=Haemaphysalis longicornis TaxID=44386 RepID=A0A9J6GL28_HAELO|nr:hypothetical protein HPB48_018723 [Haemaphysalis longicornis]
MPPLFPLGLGVKDPAAAEKVDLILYRKKKYFKFWGFGFSMRRVKGEESFFTYVEAVTKGTPADLSKVLPLDFILHTRPSLGSKKLINGAGDQLGAVGDGFSPYRLLSSGSRILGLMRSISHETAVVKAAGFGCIGTKAYADVTSTNDKMIFPGDVLVDIDGVAVEGMSRRQVDLLLAAGKPEIALSVVPVSPMRKKRFLISKMQGSTMSDIKVPSKSTAASIS